MFPKSDYVVLYGKKLGQYEDIIDKLKNIVNIPTNLSPIEQIEWVNYRIDKDVFIECVFPEKTKKTMDIYVSINDTKGVKRKYEDLLSSLDVEYSTPIKYSFMCWF